MSEASSSRTVCVAMTISGRVQGVGYRAFVLRKARGLGVTGYVRNARDGTVEVKAYGHEPDLHSLVEMLRIGPRASRVDSVAQVWAEEESAPIVFEVAR